MFDYVIELSKHGLYFAIITGVQFVLFLVFSKYKTEQTFKQLLIAYGNMFMQALFFALSLLCAMVLLTKFASISSIAILLLALSSLAIITKHIDLVKEYSAIMFDLWIVLSNGYVIYALATGHSISIQQYLVLYAIVLYTFLYQKVRSLYQLPLL